MLSGVLEGLWEVVLNYTIASRLRGKSLCAHLCQKQSRYLKTRVIHTQHVWHTKQWLAISEHASTLKSLTPLSDILCTYAKAQHSDFPPNLVLLFFLTKLYSILALVQKWRKLLQLKLLTLSHIATALLCHTKYLFWTKIWPIPDWPSAINLLLY